MQKRQTKKGFTFIETSLATLFLGIIILAVANLIIQMSAIYRKGLTLRAINSSGQQIIETMQKDINSADYIFDIDDSKDGVLTNEEIMGNVNKYFREWNVAYGEDKTPTQVAGAFCISDYVYVWNTFIPLNRTKIDDKEYEGVTIKYKDGELKDFRLARLYDPTHAVCKEKWLAKETDEEPDLDRTTYEDAKFELNMPTSVKPDELINKDEANLAVYDMTIHPITQSTVTKQSFVSATFILATLRGGVNIMSDSDYCDGTYGATDESGASLEYDSSDFEYCAVNKFDFSMSTGGNSNKKG